MKITDKYNEIRSILIPGFDVDTPKEINFGIQFSVSKNQFSRVIRIYDGKKGIKVDLSQLDTSPEAEEIRIALIEGVVPSPNNKNISIPEEKLTSSIDLPVTNGHGVIGSDESGKGDFFGPLVVAAVKTTPEIESILEGIGVRDCKQLTDYQNISIAKQIKSSISADMFSVKILEPVAYNKYYENVQNLNIMLAVNHVSAIRDLYQQGDSIIIDKFSYHDSMVEDELHQWNINVKPVQIPRAEDQSIAVAAASILARAAFRCIG
jgi:ribonuclease HIII